MIALGVMGTNRTGGSRCHSRGGDVTQGTAQALGGGRFLSPEEIRLSGRPAPAPYSSIPPGGKLDISLPTTSGAGCRSTAPSYYCLLFSALCANWIFNNYSGVFQIKTDTRNQLGGRFIRLEGPCSMAIAERFASRRLSYNNSFSLYP